MNVIILLLSLYIHSKQREWW